MILTKNLNCKRAALTTMLVFSLLTLGACSSNDDSGGDAGDTTADSGSQDGGDAGDTAGDSDAGDTDGGSDSGDTNAGASEDQYAFAATASFPTGQIERISITNGYTVDGTYPATQSDIRAKTDGETMYQLGRLKIDSLTKFDPIDTSAVTYQYSLNGDETESNPHDVVFLNETKAYVVRYGSPIIWIINPSAESEEAFKIGEIDISAYDPDTTDTDPSPKATSAVIVNGKLFVLMQRLTGFSPVETGYVAVFDTSDESEIDTGLGANGLKGIALNSLNPTDIRYNETTGEIYVTGRGNLYVADNLLPGDPYSGGLFAIDADNYSLSQLLDDGDLATNDSRGFIEHTLVLSDTKGYVSLYTGYDPDTFVSFTSVRTFNPSTGEYGDPVAALVDAQVANLTMGADGNVWIGVSGDAPGFTLLDPANDAAVEPFVATSLSPLNVIFLNVDTESGL